MKIIEIPTIAGMMKLAVNEKKLTQRLMLYGWNGNSCYDSALCTLMEQILGPNDLFVDVGAHIGFFCMLAWTLTKGTGRIYAFEPEPENHLCLRRNAMLNGAKINTAWAAVGSIPKDSVDLHINLDNDGGHALWAPGLHAFNQQTRETPPYIVEVQQVTLDEALPFGTYPLIKVDVEGAEGKVLEGSRKLLEKGMVRNWVLEVNEFGLAQFGWDRWAIRREMKTYGYDCYLLEQWPPKLMADDEDYNPNHVYNLLFTLRT